MHGVERTGVRFVLSNAADPSRADEYSAWYDTYGAGITPFRSWIRAFPTEQQMEFDIDLYYTVRSQDEALFLDEIRTAATQHPSFRPHIIDSQRDGSFTMEHIVGTCGGGTIVAKDVYLCGPSRMTESFQQSLRKLGVPPMHIHFEYFTFR
jgi:predicted ferric reductase